MKRLIKNIKLIAISLLVIIQACNQTKAQTRNDVVILIDDYGDISKEGNIHTKNKYYFDYVG